MKTTKAQFNRFKKEFLRCVEILNLKDYRIDFVCGDLNGSYGQIDCDIPGGIATVFMADFIRDKNKWHFDPVKTAKHEAIHLLLYPLIYEAKARYTIQDDINAHWEHITRVIEKIGF